MEESIGTITVGGQTHSVHAAQLAIVRRTGMLGEFCYLTLSAATASGDEGVCFHIDGLGMKPGTRLANLAGGRIDVDMARAGADDTLSVWNEEILEGSAWSIPDDSEEGGGLWMFKSLRLEFAERGAGVWRVRMKCSLENVVDERSLDAAAEFEVEASEEEE
ncbi:MAG: hypothetical protein HUU22_09610 [Phycisphaerae bacterium]|nr:hypothetical protein [Phycisphaerae bacterium]NUQ46278.1 hypothetical protein [Phycisphaerae bacterium]